MRTNCICKHHLSSQNFVSDFRLWVWYPKAKAGIGFTKIIQPTTLLDTPTPPLFSRQFEDDAELQAPKRERRAPARLRQLQLQRNTESGFLSRILSLKSSSSERINMETPPRQGEGIGKINLVRGRGIIVKLQKA